MNYMGQNTERNNTCLDGSTGDFWDEEIEDESVCLSCGLMFCDDDLDNDTLLCSDCLYTSVFFPRN